MAVVIPSYRVRRHIVGVIEHVGPEVSQIIVVDDACPQDSGSHVQASVRDPRVVVLRHEVNQGVGGAVVTGYRHALATGADIIVKVDGDGQIDPALVPRLIELIRLGEADYVKGNRFYARQSVRDMPAIRMFGNVMLSFMTKLSSGYWRIFDPTNGFTAVHRHALSLIDLSSLSRRFFFESDMLIQLGNVRAVVRDMPMVARYEGEESNLAVSSVLPEFFGKHLRAIARRVVYWYFLRDFSLASVNGLLGLLLMLAGGTFGAVGWMRGLETGRLTPTGTIMLSVLPILLGSQLILNFLSYDISNEPGVPLQRFAPPSPEPVTRADAGDFSRVDGEHVRTPAMSRHEVPSEDGTIVRTRAD